MRLVGVLALCAVIASPATAQTVEESYAKLCSGANKNSESCRVLRKALQEKLAAEDGPAESAPAAAKAAPAASAAPAGSAKPWGFWAALPESGPFYAMGTIISYRWKEKYRTLETIDEVSGATSTLALREDGRIDWIAPTVTNQLSEQDDGSFILSDGKGTWRSRYRIAEGGLQTSIEYFRNGTWEPSFTKVMRRLSADELAAARRTLEQAASPDQMRANWGLYADLAGRSFVNKSWKLRNVYAYEWVTPGVAMSVRYGALMDNTIQGAPTPKGASLIFDPVTKKLVGTTQILADGTVVDDSGGMRRTMRGTSSGYQLITEHRR